MSLKTSAAQVCHKPAGVVKRTGTIDENEVLHR